MTIVSQSQNPSNVSHLDVSDSIPDILQTLTKPDAVKSANVIVNELSEADLVDLNSPEHDPSTAAGIKVSSTVKNF